MSKKYQPSNGFEGEYFTERYCMNCTNCDPDPKGDKQCNILMKTMLYDINDVEYPTEWMYDEKDNPICTAHKYHNWNESKPKVIIIDPNQTELFNK